MATNKTERKTKVYECYHYEFEYDDFGKYFICHNIDIPGHKCKVSGNSIYCQQFCPGYKKGNLRGEWVIADWEKEEVEKLKAKLAQEAKDRETKERAMLEYLKAKYEGNNSSIGNEAQDR